jgi:hypothetical protein
VKNLANSKLAAILAAYAAKQLASKTLKDVVSSALYILIFILFAAILIATAMVIGP